MSEDATTRRERHEYRLLNSHPDELGRADFIERRSLMARRRAALVDDELSRLAPPDMRRRHKKNERHPCARS
jgi:hypothetical protein